MDGVPRIFPGKFPCFVNDMINVVLGDSERPGFMEFTFDDVQDECGEGFGGRRCFERVALVQCGEEGLAVGMDRLQDAFRVKPLFPEKCLCDPGPRPQSTRRVCVEFQIRVEFPWLELRSTLTLRAELLFIDLPFPPRDAWVFRVTISGNSLQPEEFDRRK